MSKIVVGELEGPSTTSNKITIATGSQLDLVGSTGTVTLDAADITAGSIPNARLAAGNIIQVVQNTYTTSFTQSITGTSHAYINTGTEDMHVTITPSSTSSKVLVQFNFGRIAGHNASANYGLGLIIVRDGTSIALSTDSSSPKTTFYAGIGYPDYAPGLAFSFLDSPTSSTAVTYKIKVVAQTGTGTYTMLVNQPASKGTTTTDGWQSETITTFIAQEIVG
jgi:hypothetical protein